MNLKLGKKTESNPMWSYIIELTDALGQTTNQSVDNQMYSNKNLLILHLLHYRLLIACSNNFFGPWIFKFMSIFPKFNFFFIEKTSFYGCPPLDVNFTISPSNNIQNIIWNFDDGNIISADRVSLPDIDIDFDDEGRLER